MLFYKLFLLCVLLLFATPSLVVAGPIVIDFEGLADSTPVTTQYSSLAFSHATAITAGISLNEFEFPPHSGVNVIFDDASPMSIAFTTPVTSFGGYFTYSTRITLVAFDSANVAIAMMMSAFDNNLALSGAPASNPNEFLSLTVLNGISRITITGSLSGDSFVMDDATITPVPEPGTIWLLLAGSFVLLGYWKQMLTSNGK